MPFTPNTPRPPMPFGNIQLSNRRSDNFPNKANFYLAMAINRPDNDAKSCKWGTRAHTHSHYRE